MNTGRIGVVIVAAGRGERAGQSADGPKQYRRIGGVPVIRRTLEAFLAHPAIAEVAVAIHADDGALFAQAAGAPRPAIGREVEEARLPVLPADVVHIRPPTMLMPARAY